jgi:hypothetical protein
VINTHKDWHCAVNDGGQIARIHALDTRRDPDEWHEVVDGGVHQEVDRGGGFWSMLELRRALLSRKHSQERAARGWCDIGISEAVWGQDEGKALGVLDELLGSYLGVLGCIESRKRGIREDGTNGAWGGHCG